MTLVGHLSRNEGLLLLDGGSGFLGDLDVLLRGSREVGLVDRGGGLGDGARGLAAAKHLLGLGGVVSHKLLGHLGSLGGVGTGHALELLSLGVDNVLGILKVVVDQLLVGGVDQGHGEEQGGSNESETPVRDNLNEPVREEGTSADLETHEKRVSKGQQKLFFMACAELYSYRSGSRDVLGENDALGLNDEEVNELVDIANQNIEGLAGDGVVAAGPELAGDACVHNQLACNLGGDRDAEDHPRKLETPSQHIEVSNREDEGDDGEVGNGRGACVRLTGSAGHGPSALSAHPCAGESSGIVDVRGLFQERSSEKKEW